jgi:hypothetical protein
MATPAFQSFKLRHALACLRVLLDYGDLVLYVGRLKLMGHSTDEA